MEKIYYDMGVVMGKGVQLHFSSSCFELKAFLVCLATKAFLRKREKCVLTNKLK